MESVEILICSVERLLGRLPAAADSELGRLRAQAKDALAAAKAAVASDAARVTGKIGPLPAASTYPRVNDWQVLAVAAMVGLAIGVWAGRIAHRRARRS
jgi:ElaB/YqjD/DUF883 family membrane-anchored ribosome-binding protein